MKIAISVSLFLIPILSLGQYKVDEIERTSLFIKLYKGDSIVSRATAFIAKANDNYYLVSNYHAIANLTPHDTTKIFLGKEIPDMVSMTYYDKNQSKKTKSFRLLNKKKERLFFTYGTPIKGNYKTLDIAALPISLPSDIDIVPIEIDLIDTGLVIKPMENIYFVGFPANYNVKYGTQMSFKVKSKNVIQKISNAFIATELEDIEPGGASGSPAYIFINKQLVFIGMYVAHGEIIDGYRRLQFLSAAPIKYFFSKIQ